MTADAPRVIDQPSEMHAWSAVAAGHGGRIALIPTMGALHDGHLSLIRLGRAHADRVVVSIFVNPLQFNQRADFDRYPRPLDEDLAMCAAVGTDAVYAPTAAAMYPDGFDTHVEPGELASIWEGASRPGHFRGVTTVVAKLFNAVRPHLAVFGEKDFQQLAIIRRMVADLDLGVELLAAPTRRDHDGLAQSSRNRRLDPAQRSAATVIPRALAAICAAYAAGTTDCTALRAIGESMIGGESLARLDYLAIVDPDDLHAVTTASDTSRVITAVWLGDVRLIDNVAITNSPMR